MPTIVCSLESYYDICSEDAPEKVLTETETPEDLGGERDVEAKGGRCAVEKSGAGGRADALDVIHQNFN